MPRILVLDDSAFQRQFVRGHLEQAGFEVDDLEPLSSVEVYAKVKDWMPDLVLTDYNMPMICGMDVIRAVRRFSSTMPVLVLTSIRDEARDLKLRAAGLVEIRHKPLSSEALVTEVRRLASS